MIRISHVSNISVQFFITASVHGRCFDGMCFKLLFIPLCYHEYSINHKVLY